MKIPLLLSLCVAFDFKNVNAFVIQQPSIGAVGSISSSLKAKKGLRKKSSGGGFGKSTVKQAPPASASTYTIDKTKSIKDYLNPRLFQDPSTMKDIGQRLRDGKLVVIRDAFIPEFAEAMYEELHGTTAWSKNEDYLPDGYHYKHNNVYDKSDYPPLCTPALEMFDSEESKRFMTELTGRDCAGETLGSPSYYEPGDHSLPHTDHVGQRSVAYVWHLSKNWRPEWGGGLYWAQEPLANAYFHANFNQLVLFSVTPMSSHFVTTVGPQATEKRLSFNGWWQSSWVPNANDPLEEILGTPEERLTLTHAQIIAIQDLLDDPWSPQINPPERREKVESVRKSIMNELYPQSQCPPVE
jgi:Rps23 Pro-64 3,4-dihydroxylase Tpa1-like proline 4-hydroxylase|mmetsp:Transcript_6493/g.9877  ORF Transcript_6493/g.9877 Transcript_6493/m.9877 type:complete len:354 (-) Transcript_6493:1120-2181(-)|eukprot:CAMPEP_0195305548 /NCGR_PEP_ID=MMETSP0707-20130614/36454_1 /TAXON_ID=33640 /ORGANISM="Asterionellopsis glacialis, Strain CCMP134" /LENGTH=353 /DNA_ID=CAMNT_0040369695 /DNA_START=160 /DNA_END=1221 /DNA_ORIENTATION=+